MVAQNADATLNITVKRKSSKKIGFEVELASDGHYYLTKVPPGHKSSAIGDRVLEINGTPYHEFKSEDHANELFDTFRIEVIPNDDEEEEEEEEEEDDDYEEEDDEEPPAAAARNVGIDDEDDDDDDDNDGKRMRRKREVRVGSSFF
jgi:hypothetical protein